MSRCPFLDQLHVYSLIYVARTCNVLLMSVIVMELHSLLVASILVGSAGALLVTPSRPFTRFLSLVFESLVLVHFLSPLAGPQVRLKSLVFGRSLLLALIRAFIVDGTIGVCMLIATWTVCICMCIK